MKYSLKYSANEALEMVKEFYPNNWLQKIETNKQHLLNLSKRHKISCKKAYEKFIMPLAAEYEAILFFVALNKLLEIENSTNPEKLSKLEELQKTNQKVADQLFSLEKSETISHGDKKIIRSFYNNKQKELTSQINELINSFEVIEPELIIYQQGLFSQ
ncbi:hypothetical protein LXD69_10055 [Flavobacterium sediminilitoris]|uniref:Uncharacterized protein n=1 Tax=Flavobacterium sediminilitoris TaxID=2024526 RepID=A0ABY4HI39_9FLAO|nr:MULTISPECIES: hypothetical protein [Flavobacterium]UOX32395.1 hypothetical protein LXD69_10055 [Flavobacterium sediminilitoris]